ncbi:hypothetical protein [Amycolatopsis thermoflava]|uniref:hypothetical protein n=1 Tax=Amycolatopsis thermoflava TaxID=84480 RepID=UPI0037F30A84
MATGVVALVAYAASEDPWPWLYALGAVVVLTVLGVRKRIGPLRTAAVGLVVADVIWLAAVPWWGWLLAAGLLGAAVVAGLVAVRRIRPRSWYAGTALAAAGAMVLAGGVGWIADATARAEREAQWAEQQHEENLSRILPTSPEEALRTLHAMVAQNVPDHVCGLLDDAVQLQFARDYSAATCPAAVAKLHAQVLDVPAYATVRVPDSEQGLEGDTSAWINGCAVEFGTDLFGSMAGGSDPGPRLGWLHLHRIRPPRGGMLIDRYVPCPPDSGPRTGPLPTDPRDVPHVLIDALTASNATDAACRIFSPAGAGQFADANAAPDCPAAVMAFRARITDPNRYQRSLGGESVSAPAADGSVEVDACGLHWSTLTAEGRQPPPGPQPGRLTVAPPPGLSGYWIAGYQRC